MIQHKIQQLLADNNYWENVLASSTLERKRLSIITTILESGKISSRFHVYYYTIRQHGKHDKFNISIFDILSDAVEYYNSLT